MSSGQRMAFRNHKPFALFSTSSNRMLERWIHAAMWTIGLRRSWLRQRKRNTKSDIGTGSLQQKVESFFMCTDCPMTLKLCRRTIFAYDAFCHNVRADSGSLLSPTMLSRIRAVTLRHRQLGTLSMLSERINNTHYANVQFNGHAYYTYAYRYGQIINEF